MTRIFTQIFDLSVKAIPVILTVLLLRLLLSKAPKKYLAPLWAIVALRLCLPLDIAIPSPFSLYNLEPVQTLTEQSQNLIPAPLTDDLVEIPQTATPIHPDMLTPTPQTVEPDIGTEINHTFDPVQITAAVWLTGLLFLLSHGIFVYLRLRRHMATATRLEGNIYQSEQVQSPFILGFVVPQIYIPYHLDEEQLQYVLAHERAHIAQYDHLTRPYSWLLLCVHWFNPLVWLCYFLMGRDMEMQVDETVLAHMPHSRKAYSTTLLTFAAPKPFPSPISPCIGESAVGSRIKHILSWKKPALWLSIVAILLCIIGMVVCLTNPIAPEAEPITDLAALFPEYTEVTGAWAMHGLDRWCRADPEQTTALLDLLALYATFEPTPIHYTEVHIRDNAGETHFAFDLGEKRCDIYTASYGTEDRLLFDYGSGDLYAYSVDRTSEKHKAWSTKDEKNIFSYQLYLLEKDICNSSDTSIRLRDLTGSEEYTFPTKIAAALLRESIGKALAEEILYTYDEEPDYNLEIIMDNVVYICDDELGVFHIKHKADTLYYAFPPDHLNYDKYRQDDYKYTPPPAVDMPNH